MIIIFVVVVAAVVVVAVVAAAVAVVAVAVAVAVENLPSCFSLVSTITDHSDIGFVYLQALLTAMYMLIGEGVGPETTAESMFVFATMIIGAVVSITLFSESRTIYYFSIAIAHSWISFLLIIIFFLILQFHFHFHFQFLSLSHLFHAQ